MLFPNRFPFFLQPGFLAEGSGTKDAAPAADASKLTDPLLLPSFLRKTVSTFIKGKELG